MQAQTRKELVEILGKVLDASTVKDARDFFAH
jgi:hypothetical protein